MVRKAYKYTKEVIETACKDATSISEVIRNLGLKPTGGTHRNITTRIKLYGIEMPEYRGALWNKGLTADTHDSIKSAVTRTSYSDEQIFIENSPMIKGRRLKAGMLRAGYDYKCSDPDCGISEWKGKALTLQVDHINGEHTDNRLINLRFLCPNCHTQTPTWGKSSKKV